MPEHMRDKNDPIEQRHIVGQPRHQPQPEAGFEGFALKGPEERHQGKDQQIGLIPIGKSRRHQQAGEDSGQKVREASALVHAVGL